MDIVSLLVEDKSFYPLFFSLLPLTVCLILAYLPNSMCIRVTEVGKFSKFVVSKSSYKSSPNIWCLLGLFCKTYRFKSQCVCLLLGNFWKIWSIFIRKSGHTDPHTFSFKKPFNIWLTKTTSSSSCLKMRIEKKN